MESEENEQEIEQNSDFGELNEQIPIPIKNEGKRSVILVNNCVREKALALILRLRAEGKTWEEISIGVFNRTKAYSYQLFSKSWESLNSKTLEHIESCVDRYYKGFEVEE